MQQSVQIILVLEGLFAWNTQLTFSQCLFYTLLTGDLTKLTLHQVFFDSLKLTSWPLLSFYKPKEAYYADLFRFLATMWKTKVAKD